MTDVVYDIVAPVLTDLVAAETEDRMDIDDGADERTTNEM